MSREPVYAFIDGQNLHLGVKASGWALDYGKFRLYLKNKYGVEKAYLFLGKLAGRKKLYQELEEMGYVLVFKPTVRRKGGIIKGNVDAELVLHAAVIEFGHYDKAVIVSGDGDFACLVEFLIKNEKLLCVLAPNGHYSSLLRRYDKYIKRLGNARQSLEKQKDQD